MTRAKVAEVDVAARVVAYLEACGHDVYQEVALARGGGDVADIVALVGKAREVWIVEVKVSWSLDLLEQCRDRRKYAQRVFAAAPQCPSLERVATFAECGIGAIAVYSDGEARIVEMARRLSSDPRCGRRVRERCAEGHKTHAKAGSPGKGGRFSPYTQTCEAIRGFVTSYPGATLKEAIEGIRHHYSSDSSARSSMAQWIAAGKVPGVSMRVEGGKARLYPAELKRAA